MASGGWAEGLVLSVTGISKQRRAEVQELVERAGGRYSPTLSRRCTHLAVPNGGDQGAAAAGGSTCSEKLRIAVRNQHKWGLEIVDLRWVLASSEAQQRLQEAAFPVQLPSGIRPAPAARSPGSKEQAPPNSSRSTQAAASWATSKSGGDASPHAADSFATHAQRLHLPAAAVAAAAARAHRPADPLRQSVNSRPLTSFRQPVPSLQTQSPSIKHSVQRSSGQWPQAESAAAHEVSSGGAEWEEDEEPIDYARLPMTQAGFIPAEDLLQQLRASTAGLLPAKRQQPAQQPAVSSQRQGSSALQQAAVAVQRGSLAAGRLGLAPKEQPGVCTSVLAAEQDHVVDEADEAVDYARLPMTQAGFIPAADLLEQLQASTAGLLQDSPPKQQTEQAGDMHDHKQHAEEQQRAATTDRAVQQQSGAVARAKGAQQQQQEQQEAAPVVPLRVQPAQGRAEAPSWPSHEQQGQPHMQAGSDLSACSTRQLATPTAVSQPEPAAGHSRQPQAQNGQQAAQGHAALSTAELLEQLRLSAGRFPGHPVTSQEQGRRIAPTIGILEQLNPAAPVQHAQQQQQQSAGKSTAEQLRQAPSGGLVGVQPCAAKQQHAAVLATADLVQQLQGSAQQSQPAGQQWRLPAGKPTDELLQQLQASNDAAVASATAHLAAAKVAQGSGLATADLLELVRQQAAAEPAPCVHPASGEGKQAPGLATADLLEQLRASAGAAGAAHMHLATEQRRRQQQQQQQQNGLDSPAIAELLAQLHQAPAGITEQQKLRLAASKASTAQLLEQLQATDEQQQSGPQKQQAAQQPGVSSAELLEQLRSSRLVAQSVAAAAGQQPEQLPRHRQSALATADLLKQLFEPRSAAASRSKEQVAAAASIDQMLAQLRGLKQGSAVQSCAVEQQQHLPGMAVAAGAPAAVAGGRSTEELLLLLNKQQLSGTASEAGHAASASCNSGANGPAAADCSGSGGAAGSADGLLQKLRSLMQTEGAAGSIKEQQAAPVPVQHQRHMPAVSEDAELPPAKYCRREEPAAVMAALPLAAEAAADGPVALTPGEAPDAGMAGHDSSMLPSTAIVGGGACSGIEGMAAADMAAPTSPASSAGSQPAAAAMGSPAAAQLKPGHRVPDVSDAVGTAPAKEAAAEGAAAGQPCADADQQAAELPEAVSQVAESGGGGVFAGMLAVVDPSLPSEEQQRVHAALERGGGQVAADGGSLCRGVTHVVCQPEAALKWLSMGVGILSPQWVLQSLRSGRQQRCLTMSADTSRHLPTAPAAPAGTSSGVQRGPSERTGDADDGGSTQQQQQQLLSSELLLSKEARQQALRKLEEATCAGRQAAGAVPQLMATPAELLGNVIWSVQESPAAARLDGVWPPARQQAPEEGLELVIPDSEDEEEAPGLACVSASQAAVQDVLQEAAGGTSQALVGPPAAAAWQDAVVLSGVTQLTLLLPRDGRGELGLDTRCFPLGTQRQLTAAQLLAWVHGYYREQVLLLPLSPAFTEVGSQEQLELLQSFPAAAAAAVLRPAFLELAPIPRGALLGPRCSFEGLRKATREPAAAIYELQLG